MKKKLKNSKQDKVQTVDFGRKMAALKRVRLIAIISVVTILIGGGFLFVEGFKVRTVKVEGSKHYTAQQIQDMVITDKLSTNSVYLKLKYKNKKIENIPFVEQMDVQIEDRNTVRIIVYEKAIAGYVTFLENRIYFDKDGIVVEISKDAVPGIPEISGLEFGYVVLHEPLPVEDVRIFKDILNLTQLLNKNSLVADKIYFDHFGDITLYFGDIRVSLGDGEYLDERVTHLSAILKKTEPMNLKGKLHMETFTLSNPKTTFEIDK